MVGAAETYGVGGTNPCAAVVNSRPTDSRERQINATKSVCIFILDSETRMKICSLLFLAILLPGEKLNIEAINSHSL